MENTADVEWVATWSCPKCLEPTDDREHDLDIEYSTVDITCAELVDKGGEDLEACGHKYQLEIR